MSFSQAIYENNVFDHVQWTQIQTGLLSPCTAMVSLSYVSQVLNQIKASDADPNICTLNPVQTAAKGAVWSGSTIFASNPNTETDQPTWEQLIDAQDSLVRQLWHN